MISIEAKDKFLLCISSQKRLFHFDYSKPFQLASTVEHVDAFLGFWGDYILCHYPTESHEHKLLKINYKTLKIEAIYSLDHRYIHTPSSFAISGSSLFTFVSTKVIQQGENWQSEDLSNSEENLADLGLSHEAILDAWDLTGDRKVFTYQNHYKYPPTSVVTFQGTVFLLSGQTLLQTLNDRTGEEIQWQTGQQSNWPKAKKEDLKGLYDWKTVNGTLIFANSILDLRTNRSVLTGKAKCPHNHYHAESDQTTWLPGRLIRVFKCGAITVYSLLTEEEKPKLKKTKYSTSDCSIASKKSLALSSNGLSTEDLSINYSTDYSLDSGSELNQGALSDVMEEDDPFTIEKDFSNSIQRLH